MLKSGKYQIWLLDQVLASLLFYFCHPHPRSAAAQGQYTQRTGPGTRPWLSRCVVPGVGSGGCLFCRWGCGNRGALATAPASQGLLLLLIRPLSECPLSPWFFWRGRRTLPLTQGHPWCHPVPMAPVAKCHILGTWFFCWFWALGRPGAWEIHGKTGSRAISRCLFPQGELEFAGLTVVLCECVHGDNNNNQ